MFMTKFLNLYDKILQIISCDDCANVEGYYNYPGESIG